MCSSQSSEGAHLYKHSQKYLYSDEPVSVMITNGTCLDVCVCGCGCGCVCVGGWVGGWVGVCVCACACVNLDVFNSIDTRVSIPMTCTGCVPHTSHDSP